MKKLSLLGILLFVSASFFFSCKKKDKISACTLNEANFAGSYKVVSVKYRSTPTTPETDGTSLFFEPCELDDVTTFNTNNTYTYTDAGTACVPNGNRSGTWSLTGSTLTVDAAVQPIDSFSCTNFSISQSNVNFPGDQITITFKRQ